MNLAAANIAWSLLDASQSADVLELVLAIEQEDSAPYRSDLAEVEAFFSPAWISRAIGGRTPSGEDVRRAAEALEQLKRSGKREP